MKRTTSASTASTTSTLLSSPQPVSVSTSQPQPVVPVFSPVSTSSQASNVSQVVHEVEEEKREKAPRGRPKKKEEPEEEKQMKERESRREKEQSDDEGINLDDDEEELLSSSTDSEEEEYEEERSRIRSATPTPGSIPRSQMMKLLKSADVQSLSSDCLDTAIDTFGAIIEECIKPDGMLASSDVLQFVQYHFNNGEDDLPEDVILPPTVFKDFALPFFKEKKAGFRRDAIMLLHLFAEAMIRKITIAADMIASVCKRKIIKGEDFTVAFTIYSM
jgi:histone H3/H4